MQSGVFVCTSGCPRDGGELCDDGGVALGVEVIVLAVNRVLEEVGLWGAYRRFAPRRKKKRPVSLNKDRI